MLLILAALMHFHIWITPVPIIYSAQPFMLEVWMKQILSNWSTAAIAILYFLIILAQSIQLNTLTNQYKFFQETQWVVASVYIAITAFFPNLMGLSAALVMNLVGIWLMIKLGRLYNAPNPKTVIFNIGLIITTGSIVYPPFIGFIVVAFLMLLISRPLFLNEWLIYLLGLLSPLYFLIVYFFVFDDVKSLLQFIPDLQWKIALQQPFSGYHIAQGIFLAFFFLMSINYWQTSTQKMGIQLRKQWWATLYILAFISPQIFIWGTSGITILPLIFPALAVLLSNTLILPKKMFIANVIFWIMLCISAINNWFLSNN